MTIEIMLAGGGDERVDPGALLYLRRSTDDEVRREPDAETTITLRGVRLYTPDPCRDVTARFAEFANAVRIVELTTPDEIPLMANALAVQDVDPVPSTAWPGSNAWLVFGFGPRATRLAVRETASELRERWEVAGLDPTQVGL